MFRNWIALLLWAVAFSCAAQNIDLLILDKNFPEALSQIRNGLESGPNAQLYLKQANVYRHLSEPWRAAKSLENAIAMDSTNSKYLAEYAELQVELGNPYKAISFFRRASDNSPEDLNLKCSLGKAYLNIEDYQGAFEIFSRLQTKDTTNLVYNKQFALAALKIGRTDLSIRMFESVLANNPYDFSAYLNLISLYLKNRNAVYIVRTSDRALYFFPDNPNILLREANSLYVIKEYVEAVSPFESYLAQSDSVFDVMENYGISMYFVQDDVKARKILEKCFALNPTDPFVNFYLGLICKRLTDYPKSVEYLNMAIAASQPAYLTEMHHLLGQVFGLQREFKKSIDAFQEAYHCNPLKSEILVEIATTYEEFDSNKKLALSYYRKYLNEAGNEDVNSEYAQERIRKINEEMSSRKK